MGRVRDRTDAGSVSVEGAVLLPLLLLIFLATVQIGTVFYARGVVSSAARQGLDSVRVAEGSETAGESTTRQFLGQVTAGLRDPTISIDRGAENSTVTVSANVMSVVPGWSPRIEVTVTAPTERVVE